MTEQDVACIKEFILWAMEQIGTSEAHGCAEQATDALERLSSVSGLRGVREVLAELFELVESGELVRDISRDGESDWLRRAAKLTLTLKKAQLALSLPPSPQPVSEARTPVDEPKNDDRAYGCYTCGKQGLKKGQRVSLVYCNECDAKHIEEARHVRRAPVGAQGQVQGVQESEDASSHPPSKLDGSMATASGSVSADEVDLIGCALENAITKMEDFDPDVYDNEIAECKAVLEWLPTRNPSDAVAKSAAHPEVVEKTLAVSVPPADVSSQAGQAVTMNVEHVQHSETGEHKIQVTAAPSAGSGREMTQREIDIEQAAICDCLEIVRNFYRSQTAQRIHSAIVSMSNDKLHAKRALLPPASKPCKCHAIAGANVTYGCPLHGKASTPKPALPAEPKLPTKVAAFLKRHRQWQDLYPPSYIAKFFTLYDGELEALVSLAASLERESK